MKLLTAGWFLAVSLSAQQNAVLPDCVKANVGELPAELGRDPFYEKYANALGIPIASSDKVPDAALLVARDIVIHMLSKRAGIRNYMVGAGPRMGIMGLTGMTTYTPEHRNLKKPTPNACNLAAGEKKNYDRIDAMTGKPYWESRARGLGGRFTTCAEECLLGYPGTRYYGESIFVHEFSHAIHAAIRHIDPKLWEEMAQAYQAYSDAVKVQGLWKGEFGETNSNEYWAEATQPWFWSNYEFKDGDRTVQTPDDWKAYDPKIYGLLSRVDPDHHIPMDVYYGKNVRPGRRPQ